MVKCIVEKCGLRPYEEDGVRFFSIPIVRKNQCDIAQKRSARRRLLWLSRINLTNDAVKNYMKVCSRHFVTGAPAKYVDEHNPDWAPSVNLTPGTSETVESRNEAKSGRRISPGASCETLSTSGSSEAAGEESRGLLGSDQCNLVFDESAESSSVSESVSSTWDRENKPVEKWVSCEGMRSALNDEGSPGTSGSVSEAEYILLKEEYSSVCASKAKLRDALTEAEVDKLELNNALAEERKKSELYLNQVKNLEATNATLIESRDTKDRIIKSYIEQTIALKKKVANLERRHCSAEQFSLTLEDLQNDEKVRSYTGLPSYDMFEKVLNLLCEHSPECNYVLLAPWQSLVLTLMRLRLSLSLQDLANAFNVPEAVAVHTFEKWLHIMYVCLSPNIIWPAREVSYNTMPNKFKEIFGKNVAVIIDCLELLIDKPGTCIRTMTWSHYNQHDTVKYLFGITPSGAISFISKASEGSVSDKHLFANSGLFEKLLLGDVVLASHDFDNSQAGFYCAEVVVPAFSEDEGQLNSFDITDTCKAASLRFYVEKVIGAVRNRFRILQCVLPVEIFVKKSGEEIAQIDEIVTVCCALSNLSHSLTAPLAYTKPYFLFQEST